MAARTTPNRIPNMDPAWLLLIAELVFVGLAALAVPFPALTTPLLVFATLC